VCNAHHHERCFLPIHVYDAATSRPVMMLLRPSKTLSANGVADYLSRRVRRLRWHWLQTKITLRGDGHYGRPEVMAFSRLEWYRLRFGLARPVITTPKSERRSLTPVNRSGLNWPLASGSGRPESQKRPQRRLPAFRYSGKLLSFTSVQG
jgi:hypothetical protein